MKQFDVHHYLGTARRTSPYLLNVQSSLFRHYDRRLAIPLVLAESFPGSADRRLNPSFVIGGRTLVLATLDLTSFPLRAFGEWVANVSEQAEDIVNAMDLVTSRAWE
ncbi:CcdB family protein [Azospirillum sp. TSO22-1]|uniref:CcdB family protein n=1 Tax=Azospirillum sp. TSO22-1 TaxID=716789 RepID=UPI000D60A184|nr:CcdB family protein [Azospirillum sp. TSO22-1]PWC55033.1 hypothetical protein TSO221_06380 [Azospirillum sp. TSO22-1]